MLKPILYNLFFLLFPMMGFAQVIKVDMDSIFVNWEYDDLIIALQKEFSPSILTSYETGRKIAYKDSTPRYYTDTLQSFKRKSVDTIISGETMGVLDKIFIPFFSTKKNRSGIGLSLSKQIMLLHKGHISIQSNINEGTVINLQF